MVGGYVFMEQFIEKKKKKLEKLLLQGKNNGNKLSYEEIEQIFPEEILNEQACNLIFECLEKNKIEIQQEKNVNDQELCARVEKAAKDGAENTKNMEAVRGRATYQANKGVGHLDPGAITMSYQICTLMDYIAQKL